jgi:hypothetical protein
LLPGLHDREFIETRAAHRGGFFVCGPNIIIDDRVPRHKNALLRHHCVALRTLLWLETPLEKPMFCIYAEVGTDE